MFFLFSKIFWTLVQPLSIVFILVVLGVVLAGLGRRRLGMLASGTGALVLLLSAFTTAGFLLIGPLEERFSRPEVPIASVGAIVVLGGSTLARVSTRRGLSELNEAGDRLTEALNLARLYPEAPIVFSGGGGTLESVTETEAATAERFFVGQGVAPERLRLERDARNTDENAALSAALLDEVDGDIVLVTSAFHMPRSVGLFRREGIDVVPWPTDYRSAGNEGFGPDLGNPAHNLNTLTVALREWIGLFAYSVTGRIDTVLPGP